jgi:hypothetical protein
MAVDAGEHLGTRPGWQHLMHDVGVAVNARMLCDSLVARLDLYRILKVFKRESQRVKKSIVGFSNPLTEEVMRKMAVVAYGHVAMT